VEPDTNDHNFERLLGVVQRRGVWIVACVILAAGAAFGISKHQRKQYTATAELLFNNNQLSQQIAGVSTSVITQAQPGSDVRLVRVGDMAEETARALGRGLTAGRVSDSLSVAQQGETNLVGESSVVDVAATDRTPSLAADIANVYAEKFVASQQHANRRYFTAALRIVDGQLARIPTQARRGTAAEVLESRAQSLRLLAGLQYGGVELAQRASVPTSPSSPKPRRNTLIGAVLGLLVGLGLVFLLERRDRRIRDPRELETVYRSPLLGLVPESAGLSEPEKRYRDAIAVQAPAEADAFGLILAHLRSFNRGVPVRSVLITSAASGDGKTTVALHLAETAARAGSRTLLLEMDFRSPALAHRLAVSPSPGLLDVLGGELAMGGAIQTIDLRTPDDEQYEALTLDVMTCGGDRPSIPAKLIQSAAMDAVWEQARSEYDFIVVDAAVLVSVSDAFVPLGKVDGVVIVDSVGRGSRSDAEQLYDILERSAVPLLGVVANRARNVRSRTAKTVRAVPQQIAREKLPS
jgi:capsular exopolysaccharide synthesis family protein